MKRNSGIPAIAYVFAGLLAISAMLLSLGQQDATANPSTEAYSPSGMSAFAELLRRSGVPVAINEQVQPKLLPGDIAIAVRIVASTDIRRNEDREKAFRDSFTDFIKNGGSGIIFPVPYDYLEASRTTLKSPYVTVTNGANNDKLNITDTGIKDDDSADDDWVDSPSAEMELWREKNDAFVTAYRIGKGTLLDVRNGIGATNRFIDKNDNAKAFTEIVGMLARSGKRVVFTEASFGNVHELGILETVGGWANAAWQQLLFLGIVVVFTLGKRFGIPEEYRNPQRSSRELLDAVADTFRRARSTKSALLTAYRSADAEIRLALKLPTDTPRVERDRFLPEPLQNALARLLAGSEFPSVPEEHALHLIVDAENQLEAFIGPRRAKLRSLAKLKA